MQLIDRLLNTIGLERKPITTREEALDRLSIALHKQAAQQARQIAYYKTQIAINKSVTLIFENITSFMEQVTQDIRDDVHTPESEERMRMLFAITGQPDQLFDMAKELVQDCQCVLEDEEMPADDQ